MINRREVTLTKGEVKAAHRMMARVAQGFYDISDNFIGRIQTRHEARKLRTPLARIIDTEPSDDHQDRKPVVNPFTLKGGAIDIVGRAAIAEYEHTERTWRPRTPLEHIARHEKLIVVRGLALALGQEVPKLQPLSSVAVGLEAPNRS